jgi:hypothetical protein
MMTVAVRRGRVVACGMLGSVLISGIGFLTPKAARAAFTPALTAVTSKS